MTSPSTQVTCSEWQQALNPMQRLLQEVVMRLRPAFLANWLLKCLQPQRQAIRTKLGVFSVDPYSHLGYYLTRVGEYECEMEATLRRYVKPGGVYVDMGANEGYFTVLGAQLTGPTGRALAIEPQNRLLPIIRENLRLNDLTEVELINAAVSNTDEVTDLYLSSAANSGASGLTEPSARYAAETQKVTTKRLGKLLDDLGLAQVDMMKMDIEGFEYEAVTGSPEVFQTKRIKALAIEIHADRIEARGKDPKDILRVIESAGYRLEHPHGCWVYVVD